MVFTTPVLGRLKSAVREAAKSAVFAAAGNGPWLRRRLERLRNAGVSVILNLHRVAPDDRSSYRPLAPAMFEELIAFAKREFAIVTIGELQLKTEKPKLVLSFDDGYRDFALFADPILRRHGVRANHNVIPRCMETGLPPLNVTAQDFVGKAPAELVRRIRIEGFTESPEDRSFGHRLSHFIKMRSQAEQDALAEKLLPVFFDWDGFQPTPMMSLEEVRSIRHHELGAHSFAHSSMEFETDEYLDQDFDRCADYFGQQIGAPMTIYAFPNGSCREGQAEQLLGRGVEHVLLVGEAFDSAPRVHRRFTFDARSASEARFKALGGFAAL